MPSASGSKDTESCHSGRTAGSTGVERKYTVCVIRKQEETGASQRTKIKICGLSRPEDIEAVNEVKPDYAGFVVEVPKSRRNVSVQAGFEGCTALLDHGIVSVGVFVNAPVELIVGLLQDGVLAMAQLHGQEDASYVEAVKEQAGRPVVQAFSIRTTGGCTAGICQSCRLHFAGSGWWRNRTDV